MHYFPDKIQNYLKYRFEWFQFPIQMGDQVFWYSYTSKRAFYNLVTCYDHWMPAPQVQALLEAYTVRDIAKEISTYLPMTVYEQYSDVARRTFHLALSSDETIFIYFPVIGSLHIRNRMSWEPTWIPRHIKNKIYDHPQDYRVIYGFREYSVVENEQFAIAFRPQ
jgi:hypothetical protein